MITIATFATEKLAFTFELPSEVKTVEEAVRWLQAEVDIHCVVAASMTFAGYYIWFDGREVLANPLRG